MKMRTAKTAIFAPEVLQVEARDGESKTRHDLVSCKTTRHDCVKKNLRNEVYGTPWSDDHVLVAAILAGDGAAFGILHAAYAPRIYGFALKRLRDATEAEDATQEVFLATHRSLASYQGNSSLIIWMLGIAHNVVHRRFRRVKFLLISLEDSEAERVAQDCSSTERVIEARKMAKRCAATVARDLSPLQRHIFAMKYLHRYSTRAIAASIGKSEDAVKANLYRIRKVVSAGTDGIDTAWFAS